jgi:hypothetical protein
MRPAAERLGDRETNKRARRQAVGRPTVTRPNERNWRARQTFQTNRRSQQTASAKQTRAPINKQTRQPGLKQTQTRAKMGSTRRHKQTNKLSSGSWINSSTQTGETDNDEQTEMKPAKPNQW